MSAARLGDVILGAVRAAVDDGALSVEVPASVRVERPRHGDQGEYATNVALRLAGSAGLTAREVAEILAGRLRGADGVASVRVAGPGFLQFALEPPRRGELARDIALAGTRYGRTPTLAGQRIVLPRPSADPRTLREARQAAIADALARLCDNAGADVASAHTPAVVGPVRTGRVGLDGLVRAAGADAVRYYLVRAPATAPLTLDLALLASQTEGNPAFLVRYAHAGVASLLRQARALGADLGPAEAFDPGLLSHEREATLLGVLGELPRVAGASAVAQEPYRVARYLEGLAEAYHRFYDACPVLPKGDERPTDLTRARLWLCAATGVVLARGLGLLGVPAPERM